MICFLMSALLQPNRWKIISSGNYSVRLAGEYHSVTPPRAGIAGPFPTFGGWKLPSCRRRVEVDQLEYRHKRVIGGLVDLPVVNSESGADQRASGESFYASRRKAPCQRPLEEDEENDTRDNAQQSRRTLQRDGDIVFPPRHGHGDRDGIILARDQHDQGDKEVIPHAHEEKHKQHGNRG
jgi:hypothetical protein